MYVVTTHMHDNTNLWLKLTNVYKFDHHKMCLGAFLLTTSLQSTGVCKQWTGLLDYWTTGQTIHISELNIFLVFAAS